jgi:hypothetical protein
MARRTEPRPWRQHAAGVVLLAGMAVQAFGRGVRVPVLGWIDLAIHEAGHALTMFLPEVPNAMMGNGPQTAVPLALAGVFGLRERDWLGAVLCAGWAATTLQDASVYIADAPHQRLQLIGGYHDWAFALAELDVLAAAKTIARVVWTSGLLLMIVALFAGAVAPWLEGLLLARGAPTRSSLATVAPPTASRRRPRGGSPPRADHGDPGGGYFGGAKRT